MILFVTGTGTGIGKTVASTTIVQHAVFTGFSVAALKPFETGCAPEPLDAIALARACNRPGLAATSSPGLTESSPGLARDVAATTCFYRVEPPLSPYAATLAGCAAPNLPAIIEACQHIARDVDFTLIEGAGGLLVPIDETRLMADFARSLGSKLLLVAPDRLGVLSDVLATFECAQHRGLEVAAIVLNRGLGNPGETDPSRVHNADILYQRCGVPIALMDAFDAADPTAWVRTSRLLNTLGQVG